MKENNNNNNNKATIIIVIIIMKKIIMICNNIEMAIMIMSKTFNVNNGGVKSEENKRK
jgi:hypothetical protein